MKPVKTFTEYSNWSDFQIIVKWIFYISQIFKTNNIKSITMSDYESMGGTEVCWEESGNSAGIEISEDSEKVFNIVTDEAYPFADMKSISRMILDKVQEENPEQVITFTVPSLNKYKSNRMYLEPLEDKWSEDYFNKYYR